MTKKGDFLEIDMRLQKAFDPIMQVPQKLHWSTTCGPSCICHTVWEYFVWPIYFVGCHWFAILCILLILLVRLYLGVTLRPPQDQKKDVCMIRVFNLVAGVCITMGQKVLLWICIFSQFMQKICQNFALLSLLIHFQDWLLRYFSQNCRYKNKCVCVEEQYVYIWKLCNFDVEKFNFLVPAEKFEVKSVILEYFNIK